MMRAAPSEAGRRQNVATGAFLLEITSATPNDVVSARETNFGSKDCRVYISRGLDGS